MKKERMREEKEVESEKSDSERRDGFSSFTSTFLFVDNLYVCMHSFYIMQRNFIDISDRES